MIALNLNKEITFGEANMFNTLPTSTEGTKDDLIDSSLENTQRTVTSNFGRRTLSLNPE